MKKAALLFSLLLTFAFAWAGETPFSVRLFPNPASTTLYVQFDFTSAVVPDMVELKVVNLLGKEVLSGAYSKAGFNNRLVISIEKLPPGVYFLEISTTIGTENFRQTRKFNKLAS